MVEEGKVGEGGKEGKGWRLEVSRSRGGNYRWDGSGLAARGGRAKKVNFQRFNKRAAKH